jgi:hypothetical protein
VTPSQEDETWVLRMVLLLAAIALIGCALLMS